MCSARTGDRAGDRVTEDRAFVSSLLAIMLLLTISYHDKRAQFQKLRSQKYAEGKVKGTGKGSKNMNWKMEKGEPGFDREEG